MLKLIKTMIRQIPGRGFLLTAITMASLSSVGCHKDQAQAEWWQGEHARITLVHQVELEHYRVSQGNFSGFAELKRLGGLTQDRAGRLESLGRQRRALNEELALLERKWIDLQETTIRNQRNRAIGRTFKSFESASGRQFQEVSVAAIDDAGVTIRHTDGSARLRYADLNPEQQVLFGLDADLASAAEKRESMAAITYEREIDGRMAVLQEQEKKNAERIRRDELSSKRSSSLLAAQQVDTSKARPLARAATPFGGRSWGNSGYSSYRSSYRYSGYRSYPSYRYVYNYVVPSPGRYGPTTPTTRYTEAARSGCDSPSAASGRQSFANTTLPYIP